MERSPIRTIATSRSFREGVIKNFLLNLEQKEKNKLIIIPNISLINMNQVVEVCEVCKKREKEIYQIDAEVCFDCWTEKTSPEIYSEN
jgi:hypothetical protein